MRVGERFCPGILHAVPAKDGLLMRIRVPGGLLRAEQLLSLADVAATCADGELEVTSRANLQLRGIRSEDLPKIVAIFTEAGLLPSIPHDRVRNIVTSPLAGLNPTEALDMRPFVRDLDERLRGEPLLASLHPKFTFGLDGGGSRFSHESDDLSLHAVEGESAAFRWYLAGIDTGLTVCPKHAVELLLLAAKSCLESASRTGLPARAKKLCSLAEARAAILQAVAHLTQPASAPHNLRLVEEVPLGSPLSSQPHCVNIIPSIPLGRMTAAQAIKIAQIAEVAGADLRLAPWRGIVLGAVPDHLAARVQVELSSLGLSCDGRDGYRGLAACAGITGCDASLADVRGDAAMLARHLEGREVVPGWTVNFAGCEKRCAMRGGASAELVATPAGYSLSLNGQPSRALYSPASALRIILADRNRSFAEVA